MAAPKPTRTCPTCGELSRVDGIESRSDGIYRHYKCPTRKEHGWWTVERKTGDPSWFLEEKQKHLEVLSRLRFAVPVEFST